MKFSGAQGRSGPQQVRATEDRMSVPGRIGLILIIALALVDAMILLSGARHAASAIETHAMAETMPNSDAVLAVDPVKHEPLLSTALKQINLLVNKPRERPTGI
jgi:hypothetical protein